MKISKEKIFNIDHFHNTKKLSQESDKSQSISDSTKESSFISGDIKTPQKLIKELKESFDYIQKYGDLNSVLVENIKNDVNLFISSISKITGHMERKIYLTKYFFRNLNQFLSIVLKSPVFENLEDTKLFRYGEESSVNKLSPFQHSIYTTIGDLITFLLE